MKEGFLLDFCLGAVERSTNLLVFLASLSRKALVDWRRREMEALEEELSQLDLSFSKLSEIQDWYAWMPGSDQSIFACVF